MSFKHDPHAERARVAAYNDGLCDADAALRLGIKRNTFTVWRRARRLPRHPGPRTISKVGAEETARRMLFYQLGWSDRHLARELGLIPASVGYWRRQRQLPANFPVGLNERVSPRPTIKDLHERIRRALPRHLDRSLAEEAASDLFLDILAGAIPLGDLERHAKRYGGRAIEQYASKWGPRSLDEALTDEDGFTLLDTLRDERSSSWLEEMGATVW